MSRLRDLSERFGDRDLDLDLDLWEREEFFLSLGALLGVRSRGGGDRDLVCGLRSRNGGDLSRSRLRRSRLRSRDLSRDLRRFGSTESQSDSRRLLFPLLGGDLCSRRRSSSGVRHRAS